MSDAKRKEDWSKPAAMAISTGGYIGEPQCGQYGPIFGNERDPFVGNHDGTLEYKIPKRPVRRKITGLPAFTTCRGGEYFFLPGLKGLRHLADLGG